jgi:hypothetical protein
VMSHPIIDSPRDTESNSPMPDRQAAAAATPSGESGSRESGATAFGGRLGRGSTPCTTPSPGELVGRGRWHATPGSRGAVRPLHSSPPRVLPTRRDRRTDGQQYLPHGCLDRTTAACPAPASLQPPASSSASTPSPSRRTASQCSDGQRERGSPPCSPTPCSRQRQPSADGGDADGGLFGRWDSAGPGADDGAATERRPRRYASGCSSTRDDMAEASAAAAEEAAADAAGGDCGFSPGCSPSPMAWSAPTPPPQCDQPGPQHDARPPATAAAASAATAAATAAEATALSAAAAALHRLRQQVARQAQEQGVSLAPRAVVGASALQHMAERNRCVGWAASGSASSAL